MKERNKEYMHLLLHSARDDTKGSCIKHSIRKDKKSTQLTAKQRRARANQIKNLRILAILPSSPKQLEFIHS